MVPIYYSSIYSIAYSTREVFMIQVLLADDHVLMRRGIRDLLEADPEIKVTGEAGDGREATQLTQKLKPDVLIID